VASLSETGGKVLRWLKVIGRPNGSIKQSTCVLLLVVHRNYVSIWHRFRDTATYLPITATTLHLSCIFSGWPRPILLRRLLWESLIDGVIHASRERISSAIVVVLHKTAVCDGRTNRQLRWSGCISVKCIHCLMPDSFDSIEQTSGAIRVRRRGLRSAVTFSRSAPE